VTADNEDKGRSLVPEAVSSVTAAVLTQHGLDPLAAAAVAPVFSNAVQRVFEVVRWKRQERAAVMLELAAQEAGLENEENLLHRLLRTEGGEELFVNAVNAAQDAMLDRKGRAIASALARGALAGSVEALQMEDFYVRTLAAMDAAHFEVLDIFDQRASDDETPGRSSSPADSQFDRARLLGEVGALAEGLDAALAVLTREGVIETMPQPGNETKWQLTVYGISLIRALRAVGEQLNAEDESRASGAE